MKKYNLTTGMIVELRNGWRGLVLKRVNYYFPFTTENDYIIGSDSQNYMPLSDFNDDLTYFGNDREMDIVAVYQPHAPYDTMTILNKSGGWERFCTNIF